MLAAAGATAIPYVIFNAVDFHPHRFAAIRAALYLNLSIIVDYFSRLRWLPL